MSHWNHRIVKKTWHKGEEDEEDSYGVHEVFYDDDNKIYGYTENPIDLSTDSIDSLREYLQWCMNALDKPILVDGEVEFAKDIFTVEDVEELQNLISHAEIREDWGEVKLLKEELERISKDV